MTDVFDQSPQEAFTESPLHARNSGRCTGITSNQCARCLADDTPTKWEMAVVSDLSFVAGCLGAKEFIAAEQPPDMTLDEHPSILALESAHPNCRWDSDGSHQSAGDIVRTYTGAACTSTQSDGKALWFGHVRREPGRTVVWISEESFDTKGGAATPKRVIFYAASTNSACGRRGTLTLASTLDPLDAGTEVTIAGETYVIAGFGGRVSVRPTDCSECLDAGSFDGCNTSDCCKNATLFRMCVEGETGDCAAVNTEGAVNLTKIADGQYRLEVPGQRKYELTIEPTGGTATAASDQWTIVSYRWTESGWQLCRTIGPTTVGRTGCYATLTGGGATYRIWAVRRWSHYQAVIRPQGITMDPNCCSEQLSIGPPALFTSGRYDSGNVNQVVTVGSKVDPLVCQKFSADIDDLIVDTWTTSATALDCPGTPDATNYQWGAAFAISGGCRQSGRHWRFGLGGLLTGFPRAFYAEAEVSAGCNGRGSWRLDNEQMAFCVDNAPCVTRTQHLPIGHGGFIDVEVR